MSIPPNPFRPASFRRSREAVMKKQQKHFSVQPADEKCSGKHCFSIKPGFEISQADQNDPKNLRGTLFISQQWGMEIWTWKSSRTLYSDFSLVHELNVYIDISALYLSQSLFYFLFQSLEENPFNLTEQSQTSNNEGIMSSSNEPLRFLLSIDQ